MPLTFRSLALFIWTITLPTMWRRQLRLGAGCLCLLMIALSGDVATAGTQGPWLGVYLKQGPAPRALKASQVVSVEKVFRGSAAARAGVQAGDVILQINGAPMRRIADVIDAVKAQRVGVTLRLKLWRSGKTYRLKAILGKRPDRDAITRKRWLNQPFPNQIAFTDVRSGKRIKLGSLRGKPVVLEIWATTCGPCLLAAPRLARLKTAFQKRGLVVLAATRERLDVVKAFLRGKRPTGHRVVHDPHGHIVKTLGVFSRPTFIYIDRAGVIRGLDFGLVPYTRLAAMAKRIARALPKRRGAKP